MSCLLPKKQGDFARKEYWDQFFNSRKSAFEWYGDFLQYSAFFHKYIKKSDSLLIVGCGNSELGSMICNKIGCASVLNIDISKPVIERMRKRYSNATFHSGLRFECLDVLKLVEYREKENLDPFTCIIDKGTLDAIHTGEASEHTVRTMFEQIRASMKLMARYLIITLAQEHIVESICSFFLRESNEWLINCHQLTSNRSNEETVNNDSVFPLPVYGFVLTKLLPSPDLPRLSMYPLDSPDPLSFNTGDQATKHVERRLRNWISQEQYCSLLRHNIGSGDQFSFRFSCPRTGLTAFHCVVVRAALSGRKKFKQHGLGSNVRNAVEAVFLVPFGQNNNAVYDDENKRRSLCRSANVSSLLMAFVNPRYFQPDLDSLKDHLSSVLHVLHFESPEGHNKSPILSTPDAYIRRELSLDGCDDEIEGFSMDEIEIQYPNDGKRHILRRLIYASSDFRPVVTTNAASVGLFDVLPPRDIHLILWSNIICKNESLYVGFPSILTDENAGKFNVVAMTQVAQWDLGKLFNQVHQNTLPQIIWKTSLSDFESGHLYDVIFYDPIAIYREAYRLLFSKSALEKLLYICRYHLRPKGLLIIAMESEDENNETGRNQDDLCKSLTSTCEMVCLLAYQVPDPIMADPPTTICVFQLTPVPLEETRTELTALLENFWSNYNEQSQLVAAAYRTVLSLLNS